MRTQVVCIVSLGRAAQRRHGILLDDVRRLRPGLVVLQRHDTPVQPWVSIDHPDDRGGR